MDKEIDLKKLETAYREAGQNKGRLQEFEEWDAIEFMHLREGPSLS